MLSEDVRRLVFEFATMRSKEDTSNPRASGVHDCAGVYSLMALACCDSLCYKCVHEFFLRDHSANDFFMRLHIKHECRTDAFLYLMRHVGLSLNSIKKNFTEPPLPIKLCIPIRVNRLFERERDAIKFTHTRLATYAILMRWATGVLNASQLRTERKTNRFSKRFVQHVSEWLRRHNAGEAYSRSSKV